ncbi:integrase catalytic domain-containing protein [Trichonephila clavipes]|nr:integrase catalytic domain-containing protein [Trichonephila clavipes]
MVLKATANDRHHSMMNVLSGGISNNIGFEMKLNSNSQSGPGVEWTLFLEANIFKAAKGFLKEDLLFVAEEIGEIFPDKVKISELKYILKSKEYLDDSDFVTNILVTAVSEREIKEEFEKAERLKQLEYEQSGKIRIYELELARIKATLGVSGESQNTVISGAKKKFNLPKLEFRQFSGDIKDWLQFWSQFQHIHDDDEIVPENKFKYLVQATVNGSQKQREKKELIWLWLVLTLGVDENRQSFEKKVRDFSKEKISTAANLLTTASKEVKECVFCTGKHLSRDCFQAQKMSLAERHNILREKQWCFTCLTLKHTARSCKPYLTCVICSKKHVPLMCESLKAKNQDSYRSENKFPKVEINMANNTSSPRVFLQTLHLKMVCGNKEIPVRAILDSGSQKSYVLKNEVEKMGYIPLRKEILMHSLFGGIKYDKCEHTCYRIRLRNQDNSVTCNLEALDQTSICDIASGTPGSWISELNEMKIQLSDEGEESQSI